MSTPDDRESQVEMASQSEQEDSGSGLEDSEVVSQNGSVDSGTGLEDSEAEPQNDSEDSGNESEDSEVQTFDQAPSASHKPLTMIDVVRQEGLTVQEKEILIACLTCKWALIVNVGKLVAKTRMASTLLSIANRWRPSNPHSPLIDEAILDPEQFRNDVRPGGRKFTIKTEVLWKKEDEGETQIEFHDAQEIPTMTSDSNRTLLLALEFSRTMQRWLRDNVTPDGEIGILLKETLNRNLDENSLRKLKEEISAMCVAEEASGGPTSRQNESQTEDISHQENSGEPDDNYSLRELRTSTVQDVVDQENLTTQEKEILIAMLIREPDLVLDVSRQIPKTRMAATLRRIAEKWRPNRSQVLLYEFIRSPVSAREDCLPEGSWFEEGTENDWKTEDALKNIDFHNTQDVPKTMTEIDRTLLLALNFSPVMKRWFRENEPADSKVGTFLLKNLGNDNPEEVRKIALELCQLRESPVKKAGSKSKSRAAKSDVPTVPGPSGQRRRQVSHNQEQPPTKTTRPTTQEQVSQTQEQPPTKTTRPTTSLKVPVSKPPAESTTMAGPGLSADEDDDDARPPSFGTTARSARTKKKKKAPALDIEDDGDDIPRTTSTLPGKSSKARPQKTQKTLPKIETLGKEKDALKDLIARNAYPEELFDYGYDQDAGITQKKRLRSKLENQLPDLDSLRNWNLKGMSKSKKKRRTWKGYGAKEMAGKAEKYRQDNENWKFWRDLLEIAPPLELVPLHDLLKELERCYTDQYASITLPYTDARNALIDILLSAAQHNWEDDARILTKLPKLADLEACRIIGDVKEGAGRLPKTLEDLLKHCGLLGLMVPHTKRRIPMCWKEAFDNLNIKYKVAIPLGGFPPGEDPTQRPKAPAKRRQSRKKKPATLEDSDEFLADEPGGLIAPPVEYPETSIFGSGFKQEEAEGFGTGSGNLGKIPDAALGNPATTSGSNLDFPDAAAAMDLMNKMQEKMNKMQEEMNKMQEDAIIDMNELRGRVRALEDEEERKDDTIAKMLSALEANGVTIDLSERQEMPPPSFNPGTSKDNKRKREDHPEMSSTADRKRQKTGGRVQEDSGEGENVNAGEHGTGHGDEVDVEMDVGVVHDPQEMMQHERQEGPDENDVSGVVPEKTGDEIDEPDDNGGDQGHIEEV